MSIRDRRHHERTGSGAAGTAGPDGTCAGLSALRWKNRIREYRVPLSTLDTPCTTLPVWRIAVPRLCSGAFKVVPSTAQSLPPPKPLSSLSAMLIVYELVSE